METTVCVSMCFTVCVCRGGGRDVQAALSKKLLSQALCSPLSRLLSFLSFFCRPDQILYGQLRKAT